MFPKLSYLVVLYSILQVTFAYKESKTLDVRVKLDAVNFDETVMRSKDIWFIEFMTPDCHHCVKLEPKFKKAAWVMKDRVKFGYINLVDTSSQQLARRFKVEGIPTIVIFDYGYKNKRKSKMTEYQGKREWKDLIVYAQNLFAYSENDRGVTELHELHKQQKWDRECLSNYYCVIVMVPNIKDSSAIERNKFLDLIKIIAGKNKQSFKKFAWFWLQQGDQPVLDRFINPEGFPILVWDSDKKVYKLMKEMYTEKAFNNFIQNLVIDTEEGGFTKSKHDLLFRNVERWDKLDSKEFLEAEKAEEEAAAKLEKLQEEVAEAKLKAEEAQKEAERLAQENKNAEKENEIMARIKNYTKEEAAKKRQESKEAEIKFDKEALEKDKDVTIPQLQKRIHELLPEIEYKMQVYGDKVSDKAKAKIDKCMLGVSDAIPSDDVIEIGAAVRKLEKEYINLENLILQYTTEKEFKERQAEVLKKEEEKAKGPKEMPSDDKILASLEAYAKEVDDQLIQYEIQKINPDVFESITQDAETLRESIRAKTIDKKIIEEHVKTLQNSQMKIGQAVYAYSNKQGKEKRRQEGANDEETEEVIEEVEVEVDEDGNEINPSSKTEEL